MGNLDKQEQIVLDIQEKLISEQHTLNDGFEAICSVLVWLIRLHAADTGWNSAISCAKIMLDNIMKRVVEMSKFTVPKKDLN